MNQINFEFEKVTATKEQISTLFDLFQMRPHKISAELTNYLGHEKFINTHPYRCWYLIKYDDLYLGSFYVSKENTIGINVSEKILRRVIRAIISFVHDNYKPLPPIPSVRNGQFSINVPHTNTVLSEALEEAGCVLTQITYIVPT